MSEAPEELQELRRAVVRIQAGVLALVGALLGALILFAATAWLLIKGGQHVGAHLQLLDEYFYGYSVTWPGAAIGLIYGALVGAVVGWLIGAVYNFVAGLRE